MEILQIPSCLLKNGFDFQIQSFSNRLDPLKAFIFVPYGSLCPASCLLLLIIEIYRFRSLLMIFR